MFNIVNVCILLIAGIFEEIHDRIVERVFVLFEPACQVVINDAWKGKMWNMNEWKVGLETE